ncbi:MAG: hypothetical protein P4N60_11510 [Verrucomicrobiae bacterium]|nr:hypothetical protein [Verrucomicrobiae bacterium]
MDHATDDPKYLCQDVVTLATYSEEFYKAAGIEPALVWKKFEYIVNDIPSILNKNTCAASPSVFKRAAALTIAFIATSPLDQTLSIQKFGKLTEIGNHQNAIVAFEYCRQCLHQASYIKKFDGQPEQTVTLKKKIRLSAHFYYDLIFAISQLKTDASFHFLALNYELMVYKANKGASYPEKI